MTNLTRWTSKDVDAIFNAANRYSIGYDDLFDRFHAYGTGTPKGQYPPYNIVKESSEKWRLELALAGFKKKQVNVYTQDGKLFVEGQREDGETGTEYVHRGVAARSFTRSWTLSDETEVRSVSFEDGLLSIQLGKIVPEHHHRKDYL